jgi:hypothetical protein
VKSVCDMKIRTHKLIGINDLAMAMYGARRGNRTPMELPPTDFEFPKNTVSL